MGGGGFDEGGLVGGGGVWSFSSMRWAVPPLVRGPRRPVTVRSKATGECTSARPVMVGVGVPGPGEVVVEGVVFDHDALGAAGGAGGVDDVGGVGGAQGGDAVAVRGVVVRVCREGGGCFVVVEEQVGGALAGGQGGGGGVVGEEAGGCGVAEHVGDAVGGVVGVEGR